jgi:hypothetical protein
MWLAPLSLLVRLILMDDCLVDGWPGFAGSYSSNVNLAVENSSWSDEQQLQEMYLSRKSFAFNCDRPGAGGEMNRCVAVCAPIVCLSGYCHR